MSAFVRHVALPAIAPTAVVGLYFTPLALVGCVNRGLMALAIVLVSAVAACATAFIGLCARADRQSSSDWWLVSTLILVLPIVLVLGPLG
jgi:hypothetical protein